MHNSLELQFTVWSTDARKKLRWRRCFILTMVWKWLFRWIKLLLRNICPFWSLLNWTHRAIRIFGATLVSMHRAGVGGAEHMVSDMIWFFTYSLYRRQTFDLNIARVYISGSGERKCKTLFKANRPRAQITCKNESPIVWRISCPNSKINQKPSNKFCTFERNGWHRRCRQANRRQYVATNLWSFYHFQMASVVFASSLAACLFFGSILL